MSEIKVKLRNWIYSALRLETHRQVIIGSLVVTALATAMPMLVVAVALFPIRDLPNGLFYGALAISAAIPLLIAPPLAYLALHILRMLTLTIKRVDAHTRFDGLTGLLNRNHLLDQVRAGMEGGTMLMIDADHFKKVNDLHGHDVGDEALRMIAQKLSETVGANGLVGRLGGEEFAVFLPGWSLKQSRVMAEAICRNVRNHLDRTTGHNLELTVSIGGALHRKNGIIGHTLRTADARLYDAKRKGRDCFVFEAPVEKGAQEAA